MTIEDIKKEANRIVHNIEYGESPFMGMKNVTAANILKLWPQYATDMSGMFENCTTIESVELPEKRK